MRLTGVLYVVNGILDFIKEKSRNKPSEMRAFIIYKCMLKIKIKTFKDQILPEIISKGDWIDLRAAEDYNLKLGEYKLLKLGVAMELPKGFEALVIPRSSTFKNYGVLLANSVGMIDGSYNGDNDEWKFPAIAIRETTIEEGTRICQFRIQLSQKATFWQKLKWFFSNGIKLVEVDSLNNETRGGFGSTGVK